MKIKFAYAKIDECRNFGYWLYCSWNFINCDFKREIGVRFCGVEEIHLYELPEGGCI